MPEPQVSTSAKLQALFDGYLERIEKNRSYQLKTKTSGQVRVSWLLADGRTCVLRLKGNALTLDIVDSDANVFTLSSLNTVKVFMATVFP